MLRCKIFLFSILFSIISFLPLLASGQAIDRKHPLAARNAENGKSEIEFLINLTEVIEHDKLRLITLQKDSAFIEPVFSSRSRRLYELDLSLDSTDSDTNDLAKSLLKYEWNHQRKIVDFLLQRRRSLSVQMQILKSKISLEGEVLDFLFKGETFSVIELTLNRKVNGAINSSDTVSSSRDSLHSPIPDDLGWSTVKAEQDMSKLQAYSDFRNIQWKHVVDLLTLNENELAIVSLLRASASEYYTYWTTQIKVMEKELESAPPSSDQLKSLISGLRNEVEQTIVPALNQTVNNNATLETDLNKRINRLKAIQASLSDTIRDLNVQIEKKDRWLHFLKSPLSPQRFYSFVMNSGPRILIIIALLIVLWFGVSWLSNLLLNKLNFTRYKTEEERLQRIDTLKRAFKSGFAILFLIVGVMLALSEIGINLSVLLGGAAVISVVIAFGAQSLIRDYFTGFMVLTENQYRIGNVIQINNVTGTVEDITLRMTTLRDQEGVAHFIPHGEIKMVSNLTHGWSQVSINIRISYLENVDKAIAIIDDVSKGLKADDVYGVLILGQPEMLGVEAFEESGFLIKILIKTLPVKQWIIKREFLRRIKNKFDELGIQLAVPVYKVLHENKGESFLDPQDKFEDRP